jgi:hypothetical protein
MPPAEGRDLPWELQRKHFNLGPSAKSVGTCTRTGKDCYSCKRVKVDSQSKDKKKRLLADRRKVSISNVFQMMDVTPLYTKTEKGDYVADNPPPECWSEIEKDEDGDPIGKCQRCSWNESCAGGLQIAALSGKRIDEVADYFSDDTDPTSLIEGMNFKVTKKGKTFGNISYSVESGEEYKWRIPKAIRKYITEHFKDLVDITKPATPQETEESWKGKQDEGDLPECFGEFEEKKKCKQCEFVELCSEETEIDKDSDDDDKPKKKAKKVVEEEDDDDDDDKPKKKAKKVVEEDDDDDDDDNKPKKKVVDDDDDDDDDNSKEKDILESLDRTELKAFIKNNDLEVKVTKDMEDDEIRESIRQSLAEDDDNEKPKKKKKVVEEEDDDDDVKESIKEKLKAKAHKK